MKRGTTPPAAYVRTNRISCDPCRKRKLKCDRVKPCTTCQKRNIIDQCYKDDREDAAEDHPTPASSKRSKRTPSVSEVETHSPAQLSAHSHDGLDKIKEQIQSIAKLAQQSRHTLETFMKSLPQKEDGQDLKMLRDKSIINWADIADYLPSIKDCEDLIGFYFGRLSYYIRLNQRAVYERQWQSLLYGPGIARIEASTILTSLALAAIMLPSTTSLKRYSRKNQYRWITLLGHATDAPLHDEPVDNSFAKIMLIGMTSVYHLYEGRSDRMWECIGIAIRKGIVYGLYDERRKVWATLSPIEKEYHRRLAWYSLSLERWQAFARRLPFALHLQNVHLGAATFESDEQIMAHPRIASIVPSTPMILSDGRLQTRFSPRTKIAVKFVHIELLGWCNEFLDNFTTMDPAARYHQASLLDDVLERTLIDGLEGTGIRRQDLTSLSADILDHCVEERQVEMNLFISCIFFLRCMVTRQFLMDDNAPSNLRFASLTYAQGILATIPSLTRLIKEGKRPIQVTWNANHLMAAATTFTVVILGQDLYVESQSDVTEADTSESKSRAHFPKEQMNWLADNIFRTLEGLEGLVRSENQTASVAVQLLERLCKSQGDLRALYLQRFKKIKEDGAVHGSHHPESHREHNVNRKSHEQSVSRPDYNQYIPSQYGTPASVYPASNGSGTDRSNFHSVVMQSSPASNAATTTYTYDSPSHQSSNITFSDPWLNSANALQPMSASSLLDAVLMDPTELNFTGGNSYSDILASLLQESPPMM